MPDELKVKIHAPNRLGPGQDITMRCHVNLPSNDVSVLWKKVSGSGLLPEGRSSIQERLELGDYELTIQNLREEDTGSYVCAASTILGKISEVRVDSTYLHVEGKCTQQTTRRWKPML